MAVDPTQFILGTPLQIFFIDKDTQTPLSAGKVYFYREDQITLKPVYKYVGTPGNPQFVALENPIILTPQGTIADTAGNDVLFYWKPYDDANKWDPYFVRVESSEGVEQFTRDGMPFPVDPSGGGTPASTLGIFNYINNGQYLLHYDLPASADEVYEAGEIREPITTVAYGNWTFERPSEATSKDYVTFEPRFASWTALPPGNPRYQCHVRSATSTAGVQYKFLCYTIPNVNTFNTPSQPITFSFYGQSLSPSLEVDVFFIRNFGTGGHTEIKTGIATFTLTTFYQQFLVSFTPQSNQDLPIGTGDDDYIQLALSFPTDIQFDCFVDDFMLVEGKYSALPYVPETQQEIICRTLGGVIKRPAYDGSDVGGVLRLTKNSIDFEGLPVGILYEWPGNPDNIPSGYLLADGKKYLTTGMSMEGIPYSKLYGELGIQWGNGYDYLSCYDLTDNKIRVINNAPGSVTAITDGTSPHQTGFTFNTINNGATGTRTVYIYYRYNTGGFMFQTTNYTGATPGAGNAPIGINIIQIGDDFRQTIAFLNFTGVPSASQYWTFGADTNYYVWYTVNGAGGDPAPGGTGILVPLVTGDTVFDVALKTAACVQQIQLTYITALAASAITGGAYFKAYTAGIDGNPGEQLVVWYKKGSQGSDPSLPGFTSIEIDIADSDTDIQVANKTVLGMNNSFFQVPDTRFGQVAVGLPISTSDPDVTFRYGNYPGYNPNGQSNPDVWGDTWGTFGYDFIASHFHSLNLPLDPGVYDHEDSGGFIPASDSSRDYSTDEKGRYRNTMLNYGVTKIIKY